MTIRKYEINIYYFFVIFRQLSREFPKNWKLRFEIFWNKHTNCQITFRSFRGKIWMQTKKLGNFRENPTCKLNSCAPLPWKFRKCETFYSTWSDSSKNQSVGIYVYPSHENRCCQLNRFVRIFSGAVEVIEVERDAGDPFNSFRALGLDQVFATESMLKTRRARDVLFPQSGFFQQPSFACSSLQRILHKAQPLMSAQHDSCWIRSRRGLDAKLWVSVRILVLILHLTLHSKPVLFMAFLIPNRGF